MRCLVDRKKSVPFGRGIAAIHRLGPVEAGITPGNEVAMEVSDIPVSIRKDCVVGRVRLEFHRLQVRFVILRFRARVGLDQRLYGFLHQPDAYPFAVLLANDRPVMRSVNGEFLFRHAVIGLVRDDDLCRGDGALLISVFVVEAAVLLFDRFQIFVHGIHAARSVHPAGAVIKSLINEELAPGHGAVSIQPFVAHHLQFRPEEEGGVRIDQQQGVMRDGI